MKTAAPITLPKLTEEERAAFYPPIAIVRVHHQNGGRIRTTDYSDGTSSATWTKGD